LEFFISLFYISNKLQITNYVNKSWKNLRELCAFAGKYVSTLLQVYRNQTKLFPAKAQSSPRKQHLLKLFLTLIHINYIIY